MNVNIGPLYYDILRSRDIVQRGILEAGETDVLADTPPILLPDPEYIGAYQVWFPLADGSGVIWVDPDGIINRMDEIQIPFLIRSKGDN